MNTKNIVLGVVLLAAGVLVGSAWTKSAPSSAKVASGPSGELKTAGASVAENAWPNMKEESVTHMLLKSNVDLMREALVETAMREELGGVGRASTLMMEVYKVPGRDAAMLEEIVARTSTLASSMMEEMREEDSAKASMMMEEFARQASMMEIADVVKLYKAMVMENPDIAAGFKAGVIAQWSSNLVAGKEWPAE